MIEPTVHHSSFPNGGVVNVIKDHQEFVDIDAFDNHPWPGMLRSAIVFDGRCNSLDTAFRWIYPDFKDTSKFLWVMLRLYQGQTTPTYGKERHETMIF